MSATYTARGRINKQAYASNAEAWGTELNQGALDRLDDMWGVVEVTVGADVTLTSENAISDQSRSVVLILSGAGGFNVTAPAVDKPYLVVNNCTADVDILPNAGTPATVRAGKASWYYTNAAGTTGYVIDPTLSDLKAATASIDAGSQLINNVADGVSDNDAVNKSQLDGLLNLAPISTVAGIADDVSTVAGIAADVTSVAANETNINSAVTNQANINSAVANEANINAAVTNASNINSVATNATNINAVAADEADIGTVAANIARINSVAGNETNINTVAADATDIDTVSTNIADVNAVATNMADINANATLVGGVTATTLSVTPQRA